MKGGNVFVSPKSLVRTAIPSSAEARRNQAARAQIRACPCTIRAGRALLHHDNGLSMRLTMSAAGSARNNGANPPPTRSWDTARIASTRPGQAVVRGATHAKTRKRTLARVSATWFALGSGRTKERA